MLTNWYIKNIIIPNFVKYDNPGFVIIEQNTKSGNIYQRDIFLSEELLSRLETEITATYGEKGKVFLYKIGKNFGWDYGKAFKIPTLKTSKVGDVKQAAIFLSKFIGGMWAQRSDIIKLDMENNYFEITFEDYVVCRHNGLGYLLNSGSICGLWAWMLGDFNLEGVQTKCQGRKDSECKTICAPLTTLSKTSLLAFASATLSSSMSKISILARFGGMLRKVILPFSSIFLKSHPNLPACSISCILGESIVIYKPFSPLSAPL